MKSWITDKKAIDFINEHHVLTLATCVDSTPYCSNMFYVYSEDENIFVFASDRETRHIKEALINRTVAGSIALETEIIGKIQGLQFCGQMKELSGKLKLKAKILYLKRFPYAVLSGTPLWGIEPDYFKLTDNRLGFGKKIIMSKSDLSEQSE